MEFYRMAGDVDYMLRVAVPDMQAYDAFYRRLIGAVSLKTVTSRWPTGIRAGVDTSMPTLG